MRGLYIGFRQIDDLSLMRKWWPGRQRHERSDVGWLVLMGLFAGTLLSAFLYNLVIHAGRRPAFQRWYLLWVAVALVYGLIWTNMAALVIPWLVGPIAVRIWFALVGLMVAACNMFFFSVIEDGVLPPGLIRAGRWLRSAARCSARWPPPIPCCPRCDRPAAQLRHCRHLGPDRLVVRRRGAAGQPGDLVLHDRLEPGHHPVRPAAGA